MHCLSYVFSSLFDTNQPIELFTPYFKNTTTWETFWVEMNLILTTKVCNSLIFRHSSPKIWGHRGARKGTKLAYFRLFIFVDPFLLFRM